MPRDIVVWSGGADSTLVLCQRLEADEGTHQVVTVSVEHCQVPPSQKQEKEARALIRQTLEKRGKARNWVESHVIQYEGSNQIQVATGIPQALLWIMAAASITKDGDRVYFGYIRGDYVWPRWDDWQKAYDGAMGLLEKSCVACFPLMYETKADVLRELKRRRLLSRVWYCENPTEKGRPCGRCPSCIAYKTALWQLKRWF